MGLSGLEVALSRVWHDSWQGLKSADVSSYRRSVEKAGLQVIGLHSLFYDHPSLGLFSEAENRSRKLDFMTHLSCVCRDLGGRTMIYGGGRNRGDKPLEVAFDESLAFFEELIPRVEDHGTCFCFEPLGPKDSDFINSVNESVHIVEALDSPVLRVQIDAKALVDNDELELETVIASAPYLVHVHANEPGLGALGEGGAVDHEALGKYLADIGYGDFVSIEQRMLDEQDPLSVLENSVRLLKECYK